jgi:hypothetical protein
MVYLGWMEYPFLESLGDVGPSRENRAVLLDRVLKALDGRGMAGKRGKSTVAGN